MIVAGMLAALLFAGSVWLFYPGLVSYDSILQFREAQSGRFTDTHPPLMAATWRLLLHIGSGALPMLVLEQLLYWTSFFLLALYCIGATGRRLAPFAVLAGVFPLLLSFSGVIWKDVLLAASWGVAAALILLAAHARRNALFWIAWLSSAALLLFGTAMRHNAAPAAIVLSVALAGLLPISRARRAVIVAGLALVALLAVPVSSRLLHATDSRPTENLISWDLTGISYFSGRNYRNVPSGSDATGPSCYSPRLFDACPLVDFPPGNDAFSRWRRAIAAEPVAYLKHRALVFSMLMRFGCVQCHPYIWEFGDRRGGPELGYRANAVRDALGYAVRGIGHTPLGRPYLWFALAVGLTAILWKRRVEPDCRTLALISLSGIVYAFTYFPAAVTDEFRYLYWLIFSVVLVATALVLTVRIARTEIVRFLIAPVLLLVALDTAVQIAVPTDTIAPSMATNY